MQILVDCPWLPESLAQRAAGVVPRAKLQRIRRGDAGFDEAWARAEVFLGWPMGPDHAAAENLRWVQTSSAGAGKLAHAVPESWVVTTAAGVFGPPLAEHALGMILHFTRRLGAAAAAQRERQWRAHEMQLTELENKRLLILGVGDIGRCLATRAQALGLRVTGLRRRTDAPVPPGFEAVESLDELDRLLPEADVVVGALPGTEHTRGLLDARRLGLLRPDAGLINLGRGSLIDHGALEDALRNDRLGWAALDVAPEEPLPEGHPLWTAPRLLITPHVGGRGEGIGERLAALFLDNLARYAAGEHDAMQNRFEHRWGY